MIDVATIEIIKKIGNSLIENYRTTGMVPQGSNGPYDDNETAVRNLSHLLVLCSIEYLSFKNKEVFEVINKIAEHLISMKEHSGIYIMRKGNEPSNGVIGHAWLMEGFLYAYRSTKCEKYLREADRIASMHEFNNELSLWGRPLEGSNECSIDVTLNHQLWYAATLIELNSIINNKQYAEECDNFMHNLSLNFSINSKGRIRHEIMNRSNWKGRVKQYVKTLILSFNERIGKPSYEYKENGYHLFNLYALARIYMINPNYSFFNSSLFVKSLDYINSTAFISGLESSEYNKDLSLNNKNLKKEEIKCNIYGYPYNVAGFEICYIAEVFNKFHFKYTEYCLSKQQNFTYDNESKKYGLNVHDKIIINYRIYEFYRYLELQNRI